MERGSLNVQEPAASDAHALPGSASRRTLVAGVVGNVMEWYDFGLYGYFAPVIAGQFFPSEDRIASLIYTFGVFAAGFLMRPVGAALFGHYGDRVGRKKALAASVILMAIPTTLIGLLPTYAQAGLLGPILLIVMRLVQGISVGGEYTGSMAFLVEHAPSHRRGYVGSWTAFSCVLGTLLGSGTGACVNTLLAPADLEAWGWRVPFLTGVLVGLVGLYLRFGVEETPSFKKLQESHDVAASPLGEALGGQRRLMLLAVFLNCLNVVGFYLVYVYLSTYLSELRPNPLSRRDALTINTLAMIVLAIGIPLMGMLSDHIGRKPVQYAVSAGMLFLAYPLYHVLATGGFAACLAAQCVFAVLSSGIGGTLPTLLVELIPARARCSVLSLGFNLSAAIFGGAAPLVATWLIGVTGIITAPSYCVMLSAVVTLAALVVIRETRYDSL